MHSRLRRPWPGPKSQKRASATPAAHLGTAITISFAAAAAVANSVVLATGGTARRSRLPMTLAHASRPVSSHVARVLGLALAQRRLANLCERRAKIDPRLIQYYNKYSTRVLLRISAILSV